MSNGDPERSGLSIVFLPPNFWVTPGTSEAALRETEANSTLHHLARLGVRWRVITPNRRPWNPFARGNPALRGLDLLRAIRVLLFHRRVDAVVSVFETNGFFLLLLRRLFFFRPKIVLWDASVGNPWRVLRFIQKIVYPRYDGFMMLASSQENYLKQHFPIKGKIGKIYYNVDEAFFRPTGAETDDYFLAIGDDISRDYATLMKAAAGRATRFVIKSKWRPVDGTEQREAIPPNATFISERLDDAAFRALYEKARAVVLPLHEVESPGGITGLYEAMAMGKPLIVTRSGLTSDFVVDGVHALIVPPGDSVALGAAIDRLERDEPLRRLLGANARRQIEENFSTHALATRMRDLLEDICKQPGR